MRSVGGEVSGGVGGRCGRGGQARLVGGEREADGVGVASEAVEERRRVGGVGGGEGVEQVEAGDGAAGAVGVAVGVGEDEGGAAGAVDDAGGEDAEDAAMPVGVVEDDAVGGVGAGRRRARVRSWLLDGVEGARPRWRGGRG